jgi:hypothetical protein
MIDEITLPSGCVSSSSGATSYLWVQGFKVQSLGLEIYGFWVKGFGFLVRGSE